MTDPQPVDATQHQFELDTELDSHQQGLGGCAQAAIAFAGFTIILLCIGLAGVYWAVRNARDIAANMVTPAIQETVSQMEIPTSQKKQISAKISDLAQDFKTQKLDIEDLKQILKGVVESPIAGAAATIWFTDEYINKSSLTTEQKAEATDTTQRFAKGLLENKINNEEADEIMDMISERTPNGQTQIKEALTDEQLRAALAKMKIAADASGVPADVPDINFATEFDKVVSKVLEGTQNPKASASPAASAPSTSDSDATTGEAL